MIYLSNNRESISVVDDQIGSPTYAPHLALAIMIITMDALDHRCFPFSIVHYTDAGVCSWYDFACIAIMLKGNRDCKITPILSSEFPMKADRPKFSVLSKRRFDNYYHLKRHHWIEGLEKFNI